LAAPLAPTIPTTTTFPEAGTTLAIGTTTKRIDELVKAIEQMSIQATELKKLRDQVTSLETSCELAQIQNKEDARKS